MRLQSKGFIAVVCLGIGFVAGAAWYSGGRELPAEGRAEAAQAPAPAKAAPQQAPAAAAPAEDGKLRIICFGAHPDDCELQAGGVAAMWSAMGHHVKFVSVTNGDIGHWRDAGGPLARRRAAEVVKAAQILGNATEVLDIHDGELMRRRQGR